MKKQNKSIPTTSRYTTLRQLCNLIPPHLVPKLARETGVFKQERTFSSWSQIVALMHAHLTHAIGLNDVGDSLRMNRARLSTVRGATLPSRNNFSYANKHRDGDMTQKLYWAMLEHLQSQSPGFGKSGKSKGYLRRFRRAIHAVDSTTLTFVASAWFGPSIGDAKPRPSATCIWTSNPFCQE